MLKIFINRPVLSTVISIIIVILGVIGLLTLPITQYPEVAPPTVSVRATYSGASADVVVKSVITPLEEQINGVEGMTYMTSTAGNDGSAEIMVYFKQEIDPDMAAVNVQNRASIANALLPQEVINTGVTVQKQQSGYIMFLTMVTDREDLGGEFLQNYADINIIPQIKRIQGVGDARVFGAQTYSMRIWLKPDVMAIYGLTPTEIAQSLNDQNIEAAPGTLGQNSNQSFEYTLKYTGRLTSEEQFQDIIIRKLDGGELLRLKDVAKVELASLSYLVKSSVDKKISVMMAISQTAGSNAQEIIKEVETLLKTESKNFPPGIEVIEMMNANDFLTASVDKVVSTLFEAFILVFIVVFIFLQDLRSTIIPAISIPVAIIGTFFFLQVFGFTINLLTLFALILAIGIVVDDAIVVVEAVHAKLDGGMKDAKKATLHAMDDIAGAIVSITLVMSAVFIPVSFIGGSTGVFYKQFAITLAISIIISAVNALTLSPALCALFLKPHDENHEVKKKNPLQKFYYFFNIGFDAATKKYVSSLKFLAKQKIIVVVILLGFTGTLVYLMKTTPTGFVPQEDSGVIMGDISLQPGASLERSSEILKQLVNEVDEISKATGNSIEHVATLNGISFMNGLGGSYNAIIIKLKTWKERPDVKSTDIVGMLFQKSAEIKDARMLFFGAPTLQGFGLSDGFEFQVQDRAGRNINDFYGITQEFLGALNQRDEIMYAMTTFNPSFPQYEISADVSKIQDAGISLSSVMTVLQGYIGSMYISNFNLYGKQYRVMMQADPEYRKNIDDLSGLYVKTATGEMAPVTAFIKLKRVFGPQTLSRFNLFNSMQVMGAPKPGFSTGQALQAINEVKAQVKLEAKNISLDYSGLTREEVSSSNQTTIIFMLCLIFVYFLLAAQYESYIIPLAVICSLPIGLAGTYIFIKLWGIEANIYVQITLIMLIGLLAKNAILIVEYAVARRKRGMSIVDSAIDGAEARLRPILMTSFAFIMGLMPLMFAKGAGAMGNNSIGVGAIGGMLIGTMIGLLVIPTLFIIFQTLQEKISGAPVPPKVIKTQDKD